MRDETTFDKCSTYLGNTFDLGAGPVKCDPSEWGWTPDGKRWHRPTVCIFDVALDDFDGEMVARLDWIEEGFTPQRAEITEAANAAIYMEINASGEYITQRDFLHVRDAKLQPQKCRLPRV